MLLGGWWINCGCYWVVVVWVLGVAWWIISGTELLLGGCWMLLGDVKWIVGVACLVLVGLGCCLVDVGYIVKVVELVLVLVVVGLGITGVVV